jgi:hypothetical protein
MPMLSEKRTVPRQESEWWEGSNGCLLASNERRPPSRSTTQLVAHSQDPFWFDATWLGARSARIRQQGGFVVGQLYSGQIPQFESDVHIGLFKKALPYQSRSTGAWRKSFQRA